MPDRVEEPNARRSAPDEAVEQTIRLAFHERMRSVQPAHPTILVFSNFRNAVPSQMFSAMSLVNFAVVRPAWHLMMAATSLAAALATLLSHFVTGPLGLSDGIAPLSSPPNGVPAIATAIPFASTRHPSRLSGHYSSRTRVERRKLKAVK
jgi:hypothetical protein